MFVEMKLRFFSLTLSSSALSLSGPRGGNTKGEHKGSTPGRGASSLQGLI